MGIHITLSQRLHGLAKSKAQGLSVMPKLNAQESLCDKYTTASSPAHAPYPTLQPDRDNPRSTPYARAARAAPAALAVHILTPPHSKPVPFTTRITLHHAPHTTHQCSRPTAKAQRTSRHTAQAPLPNPHAPNPTLTPQIDIPLPTPPTPHDPRTKTNPAQPAALPRPTPLSL